MITTIKMNITWDGQTAELLSKQKEKKIKAFLKDLTSAAQVEILKIESWEDEDENWE